MLVPHRAGRRVFHARVEAWLLFRAVESSGDVYFRTRDVAHLWPLPGVEYQRRAHASSELRRWCEGGGPIERHARVERQVWLWRYRPPWRISPARDAASRAG